MTDIGPLILLSVIIGNVLIGTFNLWHIYHRRRRYEAMRTDLQARVLDTLDKLALLPEWREAMTVAVFLAALAKGADVPEHIRDEARSLLPVDAQILMPDITTAPTVH